MDALAPWHIVVVAAVAAMLFFGSKQIPEMSRSLGRSLRIFKTEIKGMADDTAQPAASAAAGSHTTAPQPCLHAVSVPQTVHPQPVAATDLVR